jgi:tripartite-type tricarboxylate transporter receptor subunit TctC
MKKFTRFALGGIATTLVLALPAHAQEYPQDTISIVVGFAPGGTDDTGARSIAPLLSERLGVPVLVDSRPGAGMQVALEHVWAQPHDGLTLLWNNQQYLSTIEVSDPEIPYRTDQWQWLEVLQNDPTVIVVQGGAQWETLDELIDDMKARPDEVTVGLLTGSVQQLACKRLFDGILGVEFREVPQQSGGPMRTSLVGGHLDVICTNSSETYNLGDEVRALGIFSNRRSQLLPDAVEVNAVLAERGISETIPEAGAIRGVAVPKDFAEQNPEAFQKLYDAYRSSVDSEEYAAWLEQTGRDAVTQSATMEESNAMIVDYNQFFTDNRDIILGE